MNRSHPSSLDLQRRALAWALMPWLSAAAQAQVVSGAVQGAVKVAKTGLSLWFWPYAS